MLIHFNYIAFVLLFFLSYKQVNSYLIIGIGIALFIMIYSHNKHPIGILIGAISLLILIDFV